MSLVEGDARGSRGSDVCCRPESWRRGRPRDRRLRGRAEGGLRRLPHGPRGRARRAASGRVRAARPDVPRLPPARRPRLAHPRPRRPARGARAGARDRPLMSLSVGDRAPGFSLPDTDGTQHSLDGVPTVVVFTCNHCPYALAWQDRIAAAARDYVDRGVRFLAINSNDAERYPRDSYQAMQARVAKEDWPLPYLHDESQDVASEFGAQTTPDVFVV